MNDFSTAIAAMIAANPGIRIEASEDHYIVGFWFEAATGRAYTCAIDTDFDAALARARQNRDERLAEAEVEAEVRREVEARVKAAA